MTEVGETFGGACEVTDDDLDLAVRLTRGTHPVHVDDDAARQAGLNGRVLHGAVSAAIMASAIGQRFAKEDIALLEQSNKYRQPVYPGDALRSQWTVAAVQPGRRPGQLVLDLRGELRNQRGDVVVDASAKVLVKAAAQ